MALTKDQDIPERPIVNNPWTFKKLLGNSPSAALKAFTRVFVSPYEWLLMLSVGIIAIGELTRTELSVFFYIFAPALLFCVIIRSLVNSLPLDLPTEEEKPKKHELKHGK